MSFSPCFSNVLAVETASVVIRSQAIKLYTNHFLLSGKLLPVPWGNIFNPTFGHMWKLGQWLVVILLLLEFSKPLSWIMSLCFFSLLLMFQNVQENSTWNIRYWPVLCLLPPLRSRSPLSHPRPASSTVLSFFYASLTSSLPINSPLLF